MGKRGKAKLGRMPTGSPPCGHRDDDGSNLYVYEPEAKFVRRIFRQYGHEGMTAPAIVQGLEQDAAPLPAQVLEMAEGTAPRPHEQRDLQGHLLVRQDQFG